MSAYDWQQLTHIIEFIVSSLMPVIILVAHHKFCDPRMHKKKKKDEKKPLE